MDVNRDHIQRKHPARNGAHNPFFQFEFHFEKPVSPSFSPAAVIPQIASRLVLTLVRNFVVTVASANKQTTNDITQYTQLNKATSICDTILFSCAASFLYVIYFIVIKCFRWEIRWIIITSDGENPFFLRNFVVLNRK